ncbi:thioredoxin domain-containing protein [Microbacterium xanthum]|uniref:thioredoxin domain-containing protein n=1 Tax=Microbacterium xanthum TaxID=3079794 RepID=UPI002AD47D40|nr:MULTISPECIES: thioredoxin domain-containing protein [unclassified Microbacterium]MDZ8171305.1 thioredoxin domain-containing protein [Microbacterium sp. KSW-48]MDZ8201800.1 thioredoxin domain-containing protein [Microbacterium sp. SSW1-59]
MEILPALLGTVLLLAGTVGAGMIVRARQGRIRRGIPHEVIQPRRLGADTLGERATLLQFSTEMCAKCPGVHRTLAQIAAGHPGVRHLDIDLTHRPDIAKHFHVLQTPTTLILDAAGAVQSRVGGVPSRHMLELELSRLTGDAARV